MISAHIFKATKIFHTHFYYKIYHDKVLAVINISISPVNINKQFSYEISRPVERMLSEYDARDDKRALGSNLNDLLWEIFRFLSSRL